MPLIPEQQEILRNAIERFSFPSVYYDFNLNNQIEFDNMLLVENIIRGDLISGNTNQVKNGLSNVLHWGYAQNRGRRENRVNRFRNNVTENKLLNSMALFQEPIVPSLRDIKNIELPEFANMSFVSKVRMFLDPENSAVLDKQIMKIHLTNPQTVLSNVRMYPTYIPITSQNEEAYELWCGKMRDISAIYYAGALRAVDIERGFFQLVQEGNETLGGEILENA